MKAQTISTDTRGREEREPITGIYRRLDDAALHRELQVLARKVAGLRWSTTAAGLALLSEFSKRLDEARLEVARRAAI